MERNPNDLYRCHDRVTRTEGPRDGSDERWARLTEMYLPDERSVDRARTEPITAMTPSPS